MDNKIINREPKPSNEDYSQTLNYSLPQGINQSRVNFYEFLMTLIFLIFAIPLFLFLLNKSSSQNKNYTKNQNLQTIISNPIINATPTQVLIKTFSDQNGIKKTIETNFNPEQFRGVDNQFDVIINDLQ